MDESTDEEFETKFCLKCGSKIGVEAKECNVCGYVRKTKPLQPFESYDIDFDNQYSGGE